MATVERSPLSGGLDGKRKSRAGDFGKGEPRRLGTNAEGRRRLTTSQEGQLARQGSRNLLLKSSSGGSQRGDFGVVTVGYRWSWNMRQRLSAY